MLYSAMNVRTFLKKSNGDWYKIAISYYNTILPTFLPQTRTAAQTFWYQALSTRKQTSTLIKSRGLASRVKLMALERERRSIGSEREDERRRVQAHAEEAGEGVGNALEGLGIKFGEFELDLLEEPKEKEVVVEKKVAAVSSVALMGVSMLGNLDRMYSHATYPIVKLHTLTTGSRQRPGALLLFAYTFAGKLWFSLGYDVHGFEAGAVEVVGATAARRRRVSAGVSRG